MTGERGRAKDAKKGTVMESLVGMDAAFLALETPTTPMHVGVALVLDPPEGTRSLFSPSTRYAQIRRVIQQRLHLIPPLRQRALRVPFGLHHPVWVDDPEFDLDDHLSRASLPSPGGASELDAFVAGVMSRQLDPDRPLWEMHVVEGLEGERTALVAKVHHAILDGVSGASVLAAFLDLTPRTRVVSLPTEWDPAPLPSNAQMLRHAASSLARQPGSALSTLQAGVEAVADLGMHNRELAGRGEQPPPGFFAAPRTSFNGAVSNRKRFAGLSVPLEDVKLVSRVFEATVNDVILACVSGGLRRLLAARGEEPESSLVAMVPVSARGEGETEELGNQISGMLVSLASTVEDPVARLDAISESARVAKEQEKLHGGRFVGDLAQIALPALASRVARAVAGTRLFDRMRPPFNVTVSSVRVPDVPLFLAGSRVVGHLSRGPHGRGHRAQRDGLLVSRPGVLRDAGLPPAPPRARPGGGARRRRAGRARGARPRCPGGDGLEGDVDPPRGGSGEPRGGGADRISIRPAPPIPLSWGQGSAGGVRSPTSTRCSSPTGEWSRTRTGVCPTVHPSRCPCSGSSWSSRSSNSCPNPSNSRIPSPWSRSRNCPCSSSS